MREVRQLPKVTQWDDLQYPCLSASPVAASVTLLHLCIFEQPASVNIAEALHLVADNPNLTYFNKEVVKQ